MTQKILHLITVGLLVVSLCSCGGGPKQEIKLQLREGDTRTIKLSNNTDNDMTLSDGNMHSNVQLDAKIEMTVKSVNAADGLELDLLITAYDANQSATRNGSHYPLFENARGMSVYQVMGNAVEGQRFSAVIGADGTVQTVTGAEEIQKHIKETVNFEKFKIMKLAAIGLPVGIIEEECVAEFDRDWLSSLLEPVFGLFPALPVGKGDSWAAKLFNSSDSKVNLTLTSMGLLGDTLTTTVQGEVTVIDNKIDLRQSGVTKGTAEIDTGTGLLKRLTLSSSVTGEGGSLITASKSIGTSTYEVLDY